MSEPTPSIPKPWCAMQVLGAEPLGRVWRATRWPLLAGLALWTAWALNDAPVPDDALIYFRVADNLAAGRGWVFNPGDRVNACTSAVYPLVLAGADLTLPRMDPEALLRLVTWLGIAAMSLGTYVLLARDGSGLAATAAFCTATSSVLFRSYGMETAWMLALLVWTAWAVQDKRGHLAGLLAGSAALARPECLVVPVLAVLLTARGQRLRVAMGAGAIVGAWLVFSWAYFGSVVPASVAAKAVQVQAGVWPGRPAWGLAFVQQRNVALLTAILAAIGVARMRFTRARVGLALVVATGIIQGVAYAVGGAPSWYTWYFASANYALDLLVVVGAWWIVERARAVGARRWLRAACAVLLAFFCTRHVPLQQPYSGNAHYRVIGRWLAANTPPDAQVAATEIGYLAVYSDRPIVDAHGLIHSGVADDLEAGRAWWWFPRFRPEVVVSHRPPWLGEPSEEWPAELIRDFRADYALVFENGPVQVFQRRRQASSPPAPDTARSD